MYYCIYVLMYLCIYVFIGSGGSVVAGRLAEAGNRFFIISNILRQNFSLAFSGYCWSKLEVRCPGSDQFQALLPCSRSPQLTGHTKQRCVN